MDKKTLLCVEHGVIGFFDEVQSVVETDIHRRELRCEAPIERVDLLPIEIEMAEMLEKYRPGKVSSRSQFD